MIIFNGYKSPDIRAFLLGKVFRHDDVLDCLADFVGSLNVIHRVEMNAADVVVDQVHYLFDGIKNAGVAQRVRLVGVPAEQA